MIGFALGLAACGGGDGDERSERRSRYAAGAAGHRRRRRHGAGAERLQGGDSERSARSRDAIAVDQTTAGAPPLPAGLTPIGQMFAFTPHGTTFAVPVTVTMPFDPAPCLPA